MGGWGWGREMDGAGHINFHVRDLGPLPRIATHLPCGLRWFALSLGPLCGSGVHTPDFALRRQGLCQALGPVCCAQ